MGKGSSKRFKIVDDNAENGENTQDDGKKEEFKLGLGLGKHNQGIINPVEIEMRHNQGGIGYNKTEKKSQREQMMDNLAREDLPDAAKINMDIYNKEGEKEDEEQ